MSKFPIVLLVNQTIGPLFDDVIKAAEEVTNVRIFRGISYSRSTSFARLYSWLIFSFQSAWHFIVHGRDYCRLLVVSNPPFAPLLAPLARRPYALLLYDLYPQVLSQIKLRNSIFRLALSLIIKLWHYVNRFVLLKADCVFTLSVAMAKELRDYFPTEELWRDRVVVIPPWADSQFMRPSLEEAAIFRHTYGVEGLLLIYSGNLGLTHPLEPLLEAAADIAKLSSPPNVHTFFIGDGSKRLLLETMAHSLKLSKSRCRFLDKLPYPKVRASLSAADLAVVAIDGPAAVASLPSKAFNALACGTPLLAIAPRESALAELVHQHNCGVVIEPCTNASQHLVYWVMYFHSNPAELRKLGQNALAASNFYTSKNADRLVKAWLRPVIQS